MAESNEDRNSLRMIRIFKYIFLVGSVVYLLRVACDWISYFSGNTNHLQQIQTGTEYALEGFAFYIIFHYLEDIYGGLEN